MVDLHLNGYPPSADGRGPEVKMGTFFISDDQVVVYFDSPPGSARQKTQVFHVMVFSIAGQLIADKSLTANPGAVDIIRGPNGSVLFGRAGQLDFFDSRLELLNSVSLPKETTGIAFDHIKDQVIVTTSEPTTNEAHFLLPDSLAETVVLKYPIASRPEFGAQQLVYTVSGYCRGAAHFVSPDRTWPWLHALPACDSALITENDLAYISDKHMHVVNGSGRETLSVRLPIRETFEAPRFVGIADNGSRVLISALRKKRTGPGWPYHEELLLYDFPRKSIIFRYELRPDWVVGMGLSPDGHAVATVENGTLNLLSVH